MPALLRRYRHQGRRRAGPPPPPAADPWAGCPLFDPSIASYVFWADYEPMNPDPKFLAATR